jgi:DNA-binding IclR family transcriptional regulator
VAKTVIPRSDKSAAGTPGVRSPPSRKTPAPKAAKKVPGKSVVPDKPAYFAPALEKGLDVLELLATLSEPVSASQIAQRLGRSLQEVYRVVLALERRGYIVRPPGTDALVLSTRLFSVATQLPPFRRIVEAARPIINGLALESFQAVHMATLDGTNMCIIAQVDSPLPIGVRLKVGAVSPAIRGASGRTLIAFQTDAVREWLFDGSEANFGAAEVAIARKRVEAIRARGYEQVESDAVPGVTDVSFPIMDGTGIAVATVTMPFLASYVHPVSFVQAVALLFEAARTVTAVTGGTMPVVQLPH